MKSIINDLRELFQSTWSLLNDTSIFLSRTKVFHVYEQTLRGWRQQLTLYPKNQSVFKNVKNQIIELRKSLRAQGYNLKLGSKDLEINGFKSDDAPLKGYRRLVLFIDHNQIHYITGDENHSKLCKYLGLRLKISELYAYHNVHNLWYRWRYNILEICGADSESKDHFEKLKIYLTNNKISILKKLSNLG